MLRILEKIKSNNPRNNATKTEMAMTTIEKMIDCLRAGQLTCESSPLVSLK
jgi:hypothetical protein